MKPLNTAERNSTFWSFVLFFTLALGLIMTVISFTFMIPHKQFAELKNKVRDYDAFMSKQKGFMTQIDTINYSFKQYDEPNSNQTYLQKDITKKNSTLEDLIGVENENNRVYHKIIDNYKTMLSSKAKLTDALKQLIEVNGLMRECEDENRSLEKAMEKQKPKE